MRKASMRIATLALGLVAAACAGPAPTPGPTSPPTAAPATSPASQTPAATVAPTVAPAPSINGAKISFPNGDATLDGLLWKPEGDGPFRAVLWNHGSERIPGNPMSNPLAAAALTDRGYVVFIPLRRGQGSSPGTYIGDALDAVAAAERPALLAKLHATEQLSDQLAGLAYLRTLAYVDTGKVAVAGWSFGGIQSVLGAGDPSARYAAAVAFTPASQSWAGNETLQATMLSAAKDAGIPFLFIQAENDYSLVPTQVLTDAVVANGGRATRSIYPSFGTTQQDGHEFAVRGSAQWIDEVVAFLDAAFGA